MKAICRLFCWGVTFWLVAAGGPAAGYDTADSYDRLRSRLLTLTPAAVGLPDDDKRVLAVIMDAPAPEAIVTLATTADGSTSVYLSTGGGKLGTGTFESVRAESAQLLAMAEEARRMMAPSPGRQLPAEGTIQFCVVTADVVFAAAAPLAELAGGTHRLSPLFQQARRVMAAIRAVEEGAASGQTPQ